MPVILSFWRPESWRKSWYTASEDSVCILDCWILSALLPDLFSEENVEDSDHLLHCLVFVVQSLSYIRLFVTPRTVACQVPLSMGFSRQEYWSGLPFPSPGICATQGSNPGLRNCRQTLYRLSHHRGPRKLEWVSLSLLLLTAPQSLKIK